MHFYQTLVNNLKAFNVNIGWFYDISISPCYKYVAIAMYSHYKVGDSVGTYLTKKHFFIINYKTFEILKFIKIDESNEFPSSDIKFVWSSDSSFISYEVLSDMFGRTSETKIWDARSGECVKSLDFKECKVRKSYWKLDGNYFQELIFLNYENDQTNKYSYNLKTDEIKKISHANFFQISKDLKYSIKNDKIYKLKYKSIVEDKNVLEDYVEHMIDIPETRNRSSLFSPNSKLLIVYDFLNKNISLYDLEEKKKSPNF
jgi:hypothetical protein